jgi:hypothetical protein
LPTRSVFFGTEFWPSRSGCVPHCSWVARSRADFPCWLLVQVFLSFKTPISTACFLTQFSVPHFLHLVMPRSEQLAWFSYCAHELEQVRFSHFAASSFHLPVKSRSITVLVFHTRPMPLICGQALCLLPVRDSRFVSSSL